MTLALNCWEYMKCGREPNGVKTGKIGVCPAATDIQRNGLNHGKRAGRSCWEVTDTCCVGQTQGLLVKRQISCVDCGFYRKVKREEGAQFKHLKERLEICISV